MIKARIRENITIVGRKVIWLKTVSEGRIIASTMERLDTLLKSARRNGDHADKVKGQEILVGSCMLSRPVLLIEVEKFSWKV